MPRLLALLPALALLASCAAQAGEGPAADRLTAVAAVYPLAWIAEQVAPEADVAYLAERGQDPHDLELSPSDRVSLETADVVLYLGDIAFQPQVEEAIADAGGEVVAAAEVVGEDALLEYGAAESDADADAQNDGADDEDAGIDPHLWFDAGLMAEVTGPVGEAFAAADPDDARTYRTNAAALRDELVALDGEISALLSSCAFDEVIVSHEAYAYLLAPHGLGQHGVSGAGGHGEATPRDIAALAEEVREAGIPAVLTEPVEGRQDAEAVAAEAGVGLIEVFSLDVVSDEQYETGYPQLLREQAEAVARAAACGTSHRVDE